ncbi:hypothetical protein EAG_08377, partial [Camponotus floridanus]
NLSSTSIPDDVISLLQLGEKFSLPFTASQTHKIVHEFIKNVEKNLCNVHPDTAMDVRNHSIQIMEKFLSSSSAPSDLDKVILNKITITKKFLADHPNLLFTKADKGNVTVCLDQSQYKNKMLELLHDSNTYQIINKNPLNSLNNNLKTLLKEWSDKNYITKIKAKSLRINTETLPRAYGLPKIHKLNFPLRIIVSS